MYSKQCAWLKIQSKIQITSRKCSQSQNHLEMLIATRKAIDLEKINKRLDKSKHSDECGVCVCVCVCVCVRVHDHAFFYMQDAEWSNSGLCQQKYGSNKSVHCYGENYFNGKCTSLRLHLALGKLQNVLPPLFPTSSSVPMTCSITSWEKVEGENKRMDVVVTSI